MVPAGRDPAFRDVVAEVPEPLRPEPRGPTLGRLIEAYEADPGRAGVTAKTRLDYAFAYRVA